jgi:hypothetical protein
VANGKRAAPQGRRLGAASAQDLWRRCELVTDKAYVETATFQFAQAWVAAVHAGKETRGLNRLATQDGWMSYSEVAHAFSMIFTCRCYRLRSTASTEGPADVVWFSEQRNVRIAVGDRRTARGLASRLRSRPSGVRGPVLMPP